MVRVSALLGAAALAVLAAASGCASAPARPLAFVTPTFARTLEPPASLQSNSLAVGGGVSAIDVSSPGLDVVWSALPNDAGSHRPLRADRALQICYDRTRAQLWVGNLEGPGLTRLEAATGHELEIVDLPHEVVGIALSPDGKRLVTAARDALEAYVVDASTGDLLATIPTGGAGSVAPVGSALPSFFTAHPAFLDASHALVQDNVHGALVRLDLDAKRADARWEVGSPIHAIDRSPDGKRLVALVEGVRDKTPPKVLVLDPVTGEPGASTEVLLDPGESPRLHHGTFVGLSYRYLVANMGPLKPAPGVQPGHTLAEVDLSDPKAPVLVAGVRAGEGAGHPVLSPDRTLLYVVNHQETFVSVLDAEKLSARAPLELARAKGFGHGAAFHEGSLLVLCSTDGDLVRVAPDGKVTRRALGAVLGELEPGW